MTTVEAVIAALERLSRRYRIDTGDDGHVRLVVIRRHEDGRRRRRRVVRSVALVGCGLLLASGLQAPDGAAQWLVTASLGALCVAFGIARERPSSALFQTPVVGMVREVLEIRTGSMGDGYRAQPAATMVAVDGFPVTGAVRDDSGATVRVRCLGTDVFLVMPNRAFLVEGFRHQGDAADFVHHLSVAIGVPSDVRGSTPAANFTGSSWEPPVSRAQGVKPQKDRFVLLAVGAAFGFAMAHVFAPAETAAALGLRGIGYLVVDYAVQDVLFVRWARGAVEAAVRDAFGLRLT